MGNFILIDYLYLINEEVGGNISFIYLSAGVVRYYLFCLANTLLHYALPKVSLVLGNLSSLEIYLVH